MKKVIKIFLIAIASIVILGTIFETIEYIRAKQNKLPLFSFKVVTCWDGGSREYYGLRYKTIKCNTINGDKSIHVGSYNMKVEDVCNYDPIVDEKVGDIAIEILESSKKDIKQLIFPESGLFVRPLNYKLFSYGLDEIKITIGNKKYRLEEALQSDKITIETIIAKLEYDTTICYCNGRKEVALDGESILYTSQTYNIRLLKCNTPEGKKEIYIGNTSMNYEESFCK